jgi:ubiquinone/menaquinone biosynthesis C-methylase UbiE
MNNHFDAVAADWDAMPHRVELAKAVGEAVLRLARPGGESDVLDYGCGTGLLGLFLLPQVRSVTGADSSPGMLKVLDEKIRSGGLQRMTTMKLDLTHEPVPKARFHLIAANMVLHHINRTEPLLSAFFEMLLPGGMVAIADLDSEPGLFHGPDTAESVFHHGFDRHAMKDGLCRTGFVDVIDTTAHVIRKPLATGKRGEFPVFLIVGRRPKDQLSAP